MRLRLPPRQRVQWVKASGRGDAVVATDGTLLCLDLVRLEERWQLQHPDLEQVSWPSIAGQRLLVGDVDLQLRPIDLETGEIGEIPDVRVIGRPAATPMIYPLGDRWIFKTQDDVVAVNDVAEIRGRLDRGIDSDVTIRSIGVAADRIVVAESRGSGNERSLILYTVDPTGRRLTWPRELNSQMMPRFNAAQVIDGWLVLDAGIQLLAIPMPLESAPDQPETLPADGAAEENAEANAETAISV